jgi:hypothetical protein
MSTLTILLIASVVTGVGLGLIARLPVRQIAGQTAAMCVVAVGFWALVGLL